MITRSVLVVDDSLTEQDLKQYKSIFSKIQAEKRLEFDLDFTHVKTYQEALPILKSTSAKDIFDVLLVDYDLSTAGSTHDGKILVEEVREGINKHCKIIFYTMNDLNDLFPKPEYLIDFFNKGIFKFLLKNLKTESEVIYGSPAHQLRIEAILEAVEAIDIVQVALERYFADYQDIIDDEKVHIGERQYEIKELIDAIRRGKDEGKLFRNNLAKSIILHNIMSGGSKK